MTDFNSPAPSSPRRRQQHGLSLVELMVAMTLSLIFCFNFNILKNATQSINMGDSE